MSYKKNVLFNYISQIYVTIVGVIAFPIYIKYMGAESYGLVGFFTMLQALFGLLDIGLTPTIGRETARYLGGTTSALNYRKVFRALSLFFIIIAVVGGGGIFIFSTKIATEWLKIKDLPVNVVVVAIEIMAITIALRWICGLYRGVITGAEVFVWLSSFNTIIATLRFIIVLPVMWYCGFTPFVFFMHQLVVAILEFLGLYIRGSFLLPKNITSKQIGFSFIVIKPVLKFALTIAVTSTLWVLIIQIDKLTLSGILPLEEYGYFTLGVLVAGGIMSFSSPIGNAIMPRLARLYAESKQGEMIRIYKNSTQIVTVFAGSAAITIFYCAKELIYLWTGDIFLADKVSPILKIYSANNFIFSLIAFPYYLQYAKGKVHYNLIGNFIILIILVPGIILIAPVYGGVGTGYLWFVLNIFYLFLWVGYVHYKLEPGIHFSWIFKDILIIIVPVIIVGALLFLLDFSSTSRLNSFFYIFVFGSVLLTCALISSSLIRNLIFKKMHFEK